MLTLNCFTPCLPRYRCKSHLGEAAEGDNKIKIIVKHSDKDNFSVVEYFRIYDLNTRLDNCRHQALLIQLRLGTTNERCSSS